MAQQFHTQNAQNQLAGIPTENHGVGNGIYTHRVPTTKPSEAKNTEWFSQPQHPMYPPPRPAGPSGTTYVDLSQPQQYMAQGPTIPQQMVSTLLLHLYQNKNNILPAAQNKFRFCMTLSLSNYCLVKERYAMF